MTWEEWQAILDRIIFCFTEMRKLSDTWEDDKRARREELKKEGFDLFFKYFESLWW
jgi:hypothetical protein